MAREDQCAWKTEFWPCAKDLEFEKAAAVRLTISRGSKARNFGAVVADTDNSATTAGERLNARARQPDEPTR